MPQYYRVLLLSALGIVANLLIILGFVLFFKHEGLRINYARYTKHMAPLANAVDAAIDAKERKARALFPAADLPAKISAIARGGASARSVRAAAQAENTFSAVSFFDERGALLYSTAPDIEKSRGIGQKAWYGAFDRHTGESGFVAVDAEEHAIKIAYPALSAGKRVGSVVYDVPKRAVFGDPSKSVYFRSVEFAPAGVLLVLKNAPIAADDVPALIRAAAPDPAAPGKPVLLPAFRERALSTTAVIAIASRSYPSVSVMIAVKRIAPLTYALFIVLVLLFVPLTFFFYTLVTHLMRLGEIKAEEAMAYSPVIEDEPVTDPLIGTAVPGETAEADTYQEQMRSLPDTIAVNRLRSDDDGSPPAKKESDYFSSDKAFELETLDKDFLVPDLPTDIDMPRDEDVPKDDDDAEDALPPTLEPVYPPVAPEFAIDDDVLETKKEDDVIVDISDRLPEGALDELPADEPAEIIKVPDDYFGKEPATDRAGLSDLISDVNGSALDAPSAPASGNDDPLAWKTVIDDFASRTLVSVSLMDIMESLEREINVSAKKCLMLEKNENGVFAVTEAFDIEESTRTEFTVDPEGTFYQSMLSKKKTLYITSNPFSYGGLAEKIGGRDRADTERMLFMPVFDDGGDIKGFFVLMNAAPKG